MSLLPSCRYQALYNKHRPAFPFAPLNKFRSVFVSDRLERPDRPGPSHEGAAIIMGNSVATWNRNYWQRGRLVQADQAARMQGQYRRSLLQEAGYTDRQ